MCNTHWIHNLHCFEFVELTLNMKKILIVAFALLIGAGTMSSQQGGGGRQRMTVEQTVANMTKELNLTDEQQKQVTAIYTEFENKRKGGGNAEVTRKQMQAEREALDKQVTALLTDEQKKKFESMKQARKGGGRRQK